MALRDVILADSPTNYYELKETSGTTLVSTSGTNNLTVNGTVNLNESGPNGTKAIRANDQGYLAGVSYADIFANTNFSIEFWFKVPTTGAANGAGYPTLFRRDGNGRAYLFRYRDAALGVGPNLAESYVNGRTKYSSAAVNNNGWHHYVLTRSGTTFTEYIDGSATNWGTATGSVSAGGTGTTPIYFFAGTVTDGFANDSAAGLSLSNIAIYNTSTLSATRVQAHYDESIKASYAATPMTASGLFVNPVVTTQDAYRRTLVWNRAGTATTAGVLPGGVSGTIDFSVLQSGTALGIGNFTITNVGTNGNTTVDILLSINGSVVDLFTGFTVGATKSFNIPQSLVQSLLDAGGTATFLISPQGSNIPNAMAIATDDNVNPSVMTFRAAPNPNAGYVAGPMTGSAVFVDPAISAIKNGSYAAQQMIGAAAFGNTNASVIANINHVAEQFIVNGSFTMPMVSGETVIVPDVTVIAESLVASGVFSETTVTGGRSNVVTAEQMLADGLFSDATFSSDTSAVYEAIQMRSTGRFPTPKVNNFDVGYYDDPFYVLTNSQTDNDDLWLRFREETGATEIKSEKGAFNAIAYGNPVISDGYGTHRAMEFDGLDDYLEVAETNPRGLLQGSLEFYVRTVNGNQVIMNGLGYAQVGQGGVPVISGAPQSTLVELVDGKIKVTNGYTAGTELTAVYDGIKNVADGVWHQVVLTTWWYDPARPQDDFTTSGLKVSGVAIFIDGKLDKRTATRVQGNAANVTYLARPDTIGRQGTRYFTGALSEIVHRTFVSVPKFIIEQAYYAFFGFTPIGAGFNGAGNMGQGTRGRGNAIKILALHWRFSPNIGGGISFSQKDVAGLDTQWAVQPVGGIDAGVPLAKYGNIYPPYANSNQDITNSISIFPGARLYFQSVMSRNTTQTADSYFRDPVTDEPTVIDVNADIDVDDFDAIYLVDWPGVDFLKNNPDFARNALSSYDKFIESLKVATFDKGINLYVPSPDAAKALGLVNEYDAKLVQWDSTTAKFGYSADFANAGALTGTGKRDYRAAYENPFINAEALAGRQSALRDQLARAIGNPRNVPESMFNYYDTHRNNHHRFVASVPEFTDIPGYFLTETMWYRQDVQDYDKIAQLSFKYAEGVKGARIGDEAIIAGPLGQDEDKYVVGGNPPQTQYNLISFAPEDINQGIAVTKESQFLDIGTSRVSNPTADNATIILVVPGENQNGRTINGKIIINPNDNAAYSEQDMYVYVQDLVNNSWNAFAAKENAISKAWQVSSHRLPLGRVEIESSSTSVITGKNGASAVLVSTSKRSDASVGEAVKFAVRHVGTTERSWNWLVQPEDEVLPGEVKYRADSMTANGSMTGTTEVVANVSVSASGMNATGQLVSPTEAIGGDNNYVTLAMTASGEFINPSKVIYVEAMTGSGRFDSPEGTDYNGEDVFYFTVSNLRRFTFTRIGDK